MVYDLRKIENFVLQGLEINSRYPFSNQQYKLKKKQQLLSYTLKSLIKKGIVKSFYTLIDYSRFDVLNFRVYFKVNFLSEQKYKELVDFFVDNPYTSKVISCSGQYDLICVFFAKNASQFNKILRSFMEKFPDQLQNYMILTSVVAHEFGKKYLFDKNNEPIDIVIGGDRVPEKFDKNDLLLIDMLSNNARVNSVDVAKKLNITSRSVINKIKALEKKSVIKGYRPIINLEKIGYGSNLLLIKYHNVSTKIEKELTNFLALHSNVVSYIKVFGNHDLEVVVDTKNQFEYRKIEIEIRQKFANLIHNIENVPIFSVHKINFFPQFIMDSKD